MRKRIQADFTVSWLREPKEYPISSHFASSSSRISALVEEVL